MEKEEILYISSLIEAQYRSFGAQYDYFIGSNMVEFFGLNLSGEPQAPCTFKLYYNTAQSLNFTHPFIRELRERGMVRSLNHILDSTNIDYTRYEIGLARRTNDNMNWLLTRLAQIFPIAPSSKMAQVIDALSILRITDDEDYQKAALYYLGFIEQKFNVKKPYISTLKLHYLLRHCQDPNKIGKNFTVNNTFSLNQLQLSGLHTFKQLVDIVQPLVTLPGVEVWMAAIDFFKDKRRKYKIYLKNYALHGYKTLSQSLAGYGSPILAEHVLGYEKWVTAHPELEQYGLAICLDSTQKLTVNFYH